METENAQMETTTFAAFCGKKFGINESLHKTISMKLTQLPTFEKSTFGLQSCSVDICAFPQNMSDITYYPG